MAALVIQHGGWFRQHFEIHLVHFRSQMRLLFATQTRQRFGTEMADLLVCRQEDRASLAQIRRSRGESW
jgi:hypothetical protein